MKSSSSLLFLFLAIFSLLNPIPQAFALTSQQNHVIHGKLISVERIFQFGDSLSDTGNLVRENPITGHNFMDYPYGQTIQNPSGRCSDGLLMIDYIAKFFHLPLLYPYLDQHGYANFTYGVNFAVAGSTALDTATLRAKGIISPATNSSLSVQLNWFRSHLRSLCRDNLDCKKKMVRKSLVMMGEVGGNDYNYALLEGKSMEEVYQMVPEVVRTIKEATEEVINMGATRVVVPGNFPIGCMPIYLALFESKDFRAYDELKCLKGLNEFAEFHNNHLQAAIRELRSEHPNVAIVYGDYFWGLRWIIKNAAFLRFNINELQKTCCGMGDNKYNFNLTRMCGDADVTICENPSERYSWDGIHLTQHAYFHMAKWLLRDIVPVILRGF